jgi:hypothetical protein
MFRMHMFLHDGNRIELKESHSKFKEVFLMSMREVVVQIPSIDPKA